MLLKQYPLCDVNSKKDSSHGIVNVINYSEYRPYIEVADDYDYLKQNRSLSNHNTLSGTKTLKHRFIYTIFVSKHIICFTAVPVANIDLPRLTNMAIELIVRTVIKEIKYQEKSPNNR